MSFDYNIDYNNDFINYEDQTHQLINFERKNVLFLHFFKPKMLNFEKEKKI